MRLYEFRTDGAGYGLLKKFRVGTDYADAQVERIRQAKRNIAADETGDMNLKCYGDLFVDDLHYDYALDDKLRRLRKRQLAQNIWRHHRKKLTDSQLEALLLRIDRKRHELLLAKRVKHKNTLRYIKRF